MLQKQTKHLQDKEEADDHSKRNGNYEELFNIIIL